MTHGQEALTDQRRDNRVPMKDWVFAIFEPHRSGLGKIVDISEGGLAFHYIQRPKEKPLSKDSLFQMDVFEAHNGKRLARLSCKTIYDFEVKEESADETLKIRRCGVRFEELPVTRSNHLRSFIQSHSLPETDTTEPCSPAHARNPHPGRSQSILRGFLKNLGMRRLG